MPFVDIATGARLHYEDLGDSANREIVIALHGRLGTARHDLDNVIDWLSASYRVLGPSLRGYGESLPKPRDYPNDFYRRDARDVIALMDALGIEQAHLIGFSDGGETTLAAAGIAPERFKSVVSWGAVGYFGEEIRPIIERNYPASESDKATNELHHIDDLDPILKQWVDACLYMLDDNGDVSISLAPKITAPLLLMLGERDRLNPEAYGQRFVEKTANGRVVMFDSGHAIHREAWDDFQRVVGAFLRDSAER